MLLIRFYIKSKRLMRNVTAIFVTSLDILEIFRFNEPDTLSDYETWPFAHSSPGKLLLLAAQPYADYL